MFTDFAGGLSTFQIRVWQGTICDSRCMSDYNPRSLHDQRHYMRSFGAD